MTAPGFSPTGIRFENIEKRYGGLAALRRIRFEITPGECVALAGRNGSGKTTLLRIAAGLVRPSSGDLTFPLAAGAPAGAPLPALNTEAVRANASAGFVAHATMVYDELTAEENLLLFARLQQTPNAAERVEKLLHEVGLFDRRDSLVRTFSRGMRQRVAIARALLHKPSILLLDEPSTGLDPQGVAWLAATLRQLRDTGRTILMSLHGESEISMLATRAIRLDAGLIVADTRTGAEVRSILTFADA
ncbi:MAG TPA: ABC transporter ATP-binding protein [Methylomirabilota bacterium]|nr:ABC transporter ATP-binding protein [Methylomirabilota bacterium]